MATLTLEARVDTSLGADLNDTDRRLIESSSAAFLKPTVWKIAYGSLKLPVWMPHPGMVSMARATQAARSVGGSTISQTAGKQQHPAPISLRAS
jgi:hypothetical protein